MFRKISDHMIFVVTFSLVGIGLGLIVYAPGKYTKENAIMACLITAHKQLPKGSTHDSLERAIVEKCGCRAYDYYTEKVQHQANLGGCGMHLYNMDFEEFYRFMEKLHGKKWND